MFPTKTMLTITTLLCLPVAGAAQRVINPPSGLTLQPVLPNSESRSGDYQQAIGNTWLGGSVHADASMTRRLTITVFGATGSFPLATQHLGLNATANLLGASGQVIDFLGDATNGITGSTQFRSGQVRIALAGSTVVNQSFAGSYALPSSTSTYNLFASPVSGTVVAKVWPIATISIRVEGNVGCGHTRIANWTLPAGTADAGVAANASVYAFANAWVGTAMAGAANAGVAIQGKILDQQVIDSTTASATSGLSGNATYTLKPIVLKLSVSAQALGQLITQTLTSWSQGPVTKTLL